MAENEKKEIQPLKQDELPESERMPAAEETSEAKGEQLTSAAVRFSNQDMNIVLYEKGLAIEELDSAKKEKTVKTKGFYLRWCDIISAHNSDKDEQKQTLTLHYIEKQKNKCLRRKSATVTIAGDNFETVFNALQDQCQKVHNRPKKLFVLINPIGGNCKGVQVYERKIAPIFALAKCETTVMVSERAKHAIEIGETQDFTGYDGIICVSGDGLYQELMEGYLKQLQKAHGVDINDPKAKLIKPNIPFCLIPAGSSNGTVRCTNDGVIDFETSALRVLRGEIHYMNIVTVHEPGKLAGVCGLAFGIGLITDLLKHSDERRWMKKARYVYSIAAVLLKKRRMYDAQIEYILAEPEGDKPAEDDAEQPTKEWTVFDPEGKRYTATVFLASRMVTVNSRTVMDPYTDSGHLVLDTGCSNMGFFNYSRTVLGQTAPSDIPNLHIKDKALGVKIKILREVAPSLEKQDKVDEATRNTEGEAGLGEKKELGTEGENKDEQQQKNDNKADMSDSIKEHEETPETEENEGAKQSKESSKPKPAQEATDESKKVEKRNRKSEAMARSVARDSELEHYIYLDGEVRRADGLEFECRLHAGFVPMFGCVAADLINTPTAGV